MLFLLYRIFRSISRVQTISPLSMGRARLSSKRELGANRIGIEKSSKHKMARKRNAIEAREFIQSQVKGLASLVAGQERKSMNETNQRQYGEFTTNDSIGK